MQSSGRLALVSDQCVFLVRRDEAIVWMSSIARQADDVQAHQISVHKHTPAYKTSAATKRTERGTGTERERRREKQPQREAPIERGDRD